MIYPKASWLRVPAPAPVSQDFFWDDLLEYIEERRVIPIVGAELLTVPDGAGGEIPLIRVLAAKLAERLRVAAEVDEPDAEHGRAGGAQQSAAEQQVGA